MDKATRQNDFILDRLPVAERLPAGFKPPEHRLGSFLLTPSVRVMSVFDSNIYASRTNTKSDFIDVLSPQLDIRSLNKSRGIDAMLRSEHGFYWHHSDENFHDILTEVSPYVVITRALKLKGILSWQKGHEDRTSESGLNTSAAEEPAQWQRTLGRLEAEYKRGRIGFTPFGQFTQTRLDNVARVGGGQSFINDDRDRDEIELGAEISCDITDRSAVYWRSFWFDKNYERNDFDTGAGTYTGDNRNSDGLHSVIGLRVPVTNLVALDINAGYHRQDFSDTSFDALNVLIGQAELNWHVSPLTTVTFSAAREVLDTAQDGAAAFIAHTARTKISHELRRNLTADVGFFIGQHDYKDFDRDDNLIGGGAGVTWRMNRHLHWRTAYVYEDRDSTIAANHFDKHRAFLSLKVPF